MIIIINSHVHSIHICNEPQELTECPPGQASHSAQDLHKENKNRFTVCTFLKKVKVNVLATRLLLWQTVFAPLLMWTCCVVSVLIQALEEGRQVFDPLLRKFAQQVYTRVTDE